MVLRIVGLQGFGLPRDYWILVSSVLLVNVAVIGFIPFTPLYLSRLGARVDQVGISLALSQLFFIGLVPFGGYIGDVVGRRNILVIGPILVSASFALLSIAPTWHIAIPALMLSLVPGAFTAPAIQAYVGDVVDASRLGRAFGTYTSMLSLAGVAGSLLIGILITLYDYRTTAFVLAIWAFLSATTRILLRETVTARRQLSAKDAAKRIQAVISSGPLRNTIIFRAFYLALVSSVFVYLFPILLRTEYGLSELQIGTIIAAEHFVYSLAIPFGGKISERGRWPLLLSINIIGQGFAIFLIANISSYFLLLLAYPLSSLLTIFLLPITESKLAAQAPKELRGSVFGALNSAAAATSLVIFWIVGAVWQTIGPYQTLYAIAILIVLLTPASQLLVRHHAGTGSA